MKNRTKKITANAGFLIGALLVSNLLNFVFNAFLGRMLSFEDFGLITLLSSFGYITAIFLNALATTINHRVAYLASQAGKKTGIAFARGIFRKSLIIALVSSIVWILGVPYLSQFFNERSLLPLLIFTPVFSFVVITAIQKGTLQGNLYFTSVGIILLFESLVKLLIAVLFVTLNISSLVYLSIPISMIASYCIAVMITSRKFRAFISPGSQTKTTYGFPRRFFIASIVTGISTTLFLTLDVILAKLFLSPVLAGEYALLSLVGKMIYFFGSLPSIFIVTFVGRDEGGGINPNRTFYKLFVATFLLVIIAFLFLGRLGNITIPLLFGEKATGILPYAFSYALAISLFTLTSSLYTYHLARRHYLFSFASIVISLIMSGGIIFYHQNIFEITGIILNTSLIGFIAVLLLHFLQRDGQFILRNLVDLVNVFFPLPSVSVAAGKKRILIFNWRDTKHKYAGGAEVYIHELAKRWVKAGHHVTLFCGNDSKCSRNEVIDGIWVIRRGGFYFVYLWAYLYYLLKFRGRYDLVIDCENGIPFFTPLYVKEPVFCVIHHVHQEVFIRYLPKPLSLIASVLENRVMPWAYRNAKFITVSESTKKDMNNLNIKGIATEIIPNGVDLEKLKPGVKNKSPLVLYLGRLKSYKSINVLITSFKKVVEIIPEVRLIIAGDGEERVGLERLTKRLKLSDKITFLGRVSEKKKIRLMQRAWVFVNPSFMEGWGITSIEANACGTPVVASNVPGLRDSVKNPHSGFLVPYGDVELFADRITFLLKNKNVRRQMSGQAVHWAKKFEWDKSVKKFNSIFNSLI